MLKGQPHLNTSSNTIVQLMDGSKQEYANAAKSFVDVRDVAEAHVQCLEKSAAWKGWGKRFVLITACEHWQKVCEYIKEALPKDSPHQAMVPSKMSAQLGTAMFGPAPPHPVLFDAS